MEVRGRRSRDMSPDRIKVCSQPRVIRPFKRVQVVYYLSRNGQLEHPHYMEVTHLASQNLRLKDVTDRLTVLRGKGMPSMYSWSCKRSYKNGYVWNDLSENDIIYPSEGAEYILKGSETIEGCTEKFQHLQLGITQQMQSTNFRPKGKPKVAKWHPELEMENNHFMKDVEEEEEDDHDEYYEEKISYTTTPRFRCSRGVSTNELEKPQQQQQQKYRENLKSPVIELTLDDSSPPSTTSSILSDKANDSNKTSKRFEDGDPVGTEPLLSRNSMLFQLIACGGSLPCKAKNFPSMRQQPPAAVARKSNCSDLHKGVLRKNAAVKVVVEEVEDEIKCMSENPRFGNLQGEEKEYFSGSIVQAMSTNERAQIQPSLKKSSSYNEERSCKAALAEAAAAVLEDQVEKPKRREKTIMKGKCIPIKKSSTKQNKN